ncbi:MAG: CDP-alcohol phosphatidyltransferase family protein [Candidatus Hydrogenedentes bacterium]|nr:CDP-alcohol phosphatidyltransferase family protein [Candidatus Hydrogenedentota bacterium]
MTSTADIRSRIAAWSVHLLTATGALVGVLAITELYHDHDIAFFWCLVVATAIDACDGYLARRFRVKEVLPGFDGALLDNIVDYFTYVIVPAVFIYERGLVPEFTGMIAAALMVLASAYQFCQSKAKTEDHYFLGWPSYWNIVVLYLFLLHLAPIMNLAIIVLCAILVFVPIKYLYPSRTERYRTLTISLTALWALSLLVILAQYPEHSRILVWLSLAYVVYYALASLYLTRRG